MGLKENIRYITQTGSSSIFNMAVSVVRSKIVAILIGTTGFGIIGQLTSLINIARFLTALGMEQGFINEVAKAKRGNDSEAYENLSRTFFAATIWMSFLLAALIFFLAKPISTFLFSSQEYVWFIKVISPLICTIGLDIAYNAFLAANKHIKHLVFKAIISSILTSTATVALVYFYRIDGIVYGFVVNGFINVGLGVYFLRINRIHTHLRNVLVQMIHLKSFRILIKYGSILMYSSLIYQFVNLGIKNIIIEQSTISEVGIYQAAVNISKQYMPIFFMSLSTYLLPHLASIDSLTERIRETNQSIRALLLMATPPMFIVLCFSQPLIKVLYSEDFIMSAPLVSILVIADYFGLINKIAATFMISEKGMIQLFFLDTVVAITMYLFVFFTFSSYGLNAAVYASVLASITYFIGTLILLKVSFNFKIEFGNFSFMIWTIVNMVVMIKLFNSYSVVFKIGYLVLFFSATYFIILNQKERKEVPKVFKRFLQSIKRI